MWFCRFLCLGDTCVAVGYSVWGDTCGVCRELCVGRQVCRFNLLCVGIHMWSCRLLCVGNNFRIVGYCVWGDKCGNLGYCV